MNEVQHTICRRCRQPITWANKPDGRRHRPLERESSPSHLYVIKADGVVEQIVPDGPVYVAHVCGPQVD